MRLSYSNILIIFVLASSLSGQSHTPDRFALRMAVKDTFMNEGLLSNIVAEIKLMGDSLTWFGTGRGLAPHDGLSVYSHRTTLDTLSDELPSLLPPVKAEIFLTVPFFLLLIRCTVDNFSFDFLFSILSKFSKVAAVNAKDIALIKNVY